VVWSESAQKIAVIEDETNIKTSTYTEVIYTISPQGTDLSKIFQGDMYSGPVWSPNGKLLAVELMGTNGAENTTVIMNANGSDQHTLTLGCSGYISWTPNSASIVCPGDGPAIYVENVNSTEAYVEVPASVLTPGTAFGSAAALSPNGTQVVYTTYPYAKTATAGRVEIYTLATKSNKDVYGYTYSRTSNNYIDMVSWSPDSQQVAFAYFGVLFTVNNNGAGLRILDKMPYLSGIDWTTQ
jgi:Tol biopolymer transport system component